MVDRQGQQEGLLLFLQRGHPGLELQGIRHQVAVAGHGGFGDAGRPAGVLEQSDIVGGDLRRCRGPRSLRYLRYLRDLR